MLSLTAPMVMRPIAATLGLAALASCGGGVEKKGTGAAALQDLGARCTALRG